MALALAVLQIALLAIALVLLLRRREAKDDSRLATELTTQFARLDAQLTALGNHVRADLAQIRLLLAGWESFHRGRT